MTTKRRVNGKSENSAQERPALAEIVETGWDMDEIKRVQEVSTLMSETTGGVSRQGP